MVGRKPSWLRVRIGAGSEFRNVRSVLAERGLTTVCEHTRCPNRGECWSLGTATFMILGDTCTRNCGFCAVKTGARGAGVDGDEPANLADAVKELGLDYVVLTSVTRDDLGDKGAGHYADCIKAVRETGAKLEVLIPDYAGDELKTVVKAGPDVIAHNIEVVESLQDLRDGRATYQRSLQTLLDVKKHNRDIITKSSIMLGLGEEDIEVLDAMDDLRAVGCDILVLGQYLQPSRKKAAVVEYLPLVRFKEYAAAARGKGFKHVVSHPLARTSYHAKDIFK
jgi:lipoic acid synthetase